MRIRNFVCLLCALSAFGKVSAQSPDPSHGQQGVLVSLSLLDTPDSCGKDFAGDIYFAMRGKVFVFSRVGSKFQFERSTDLGLTPAESRHVRVRNGHPSIQRSNSIFENDGDGRWLYKVQAAYPFDDFAPTFDGRWVLFDTQNPATGISAHAIVTDGSSQGAEVILPWPKILFSRPPRSDFEFFYYTKAQVIPYEEMIVVYGLVSGRMQILNTTDNSVREIKLPWSGSTDEDPERDQASIEARVPKRVQVIPAQDDELIFVWDRNLVGIRSGAEAVSVNRSKGRDYQAIAVNLETGHQRDLPVPQGAELPLYSPDGMSLVSLKTVLDLQDPPKPTVNPIP